MATRVFGFIDAPFSKRIIRRAKPRASSPPHDAPVLAYLFLRLRLGLDQRRFGLGGFFLKIAVGFGDQAGPGESRLDLGLLAKPRVVGLQDLECGIDIGDDVFGPCPCRRSGVALDRTNRH